MDASKRFQELRLSRGFLPVAVALPEGQPGVASGHSQAQGRGKRPVASLRARASLHRPSPELRAQRNAKAAVDLAIGPAHALHHKQPHSVLRPVRTSAPANLLIDQFGPERPDAVMLDPGASSVLAGYQLAYVSHLEFIGYPDQIQFSRCAKDLWFGGGWSASPSS